MALHIGVNYHPHDWDEERWKIDIKMMKDAGFEYVRIAHLAWDCFEPDEGVYTFEMYDKVMDMLADAGIKAVFDIPMRPAPLWVHKLCPGCDIGGPSGNHSGAVRRYMDDVGDEGYKYYALRFARKLIRHYKNHPALYAWGLCNEQGSGFFSLSEFSRKRFAKWLSKRYKTVDALNKAWATQRWSRKLTSFDDVIFPVNESAVGAPEPWLDMRRFFSDNTSDFLIDLKNVVAQEDPDHLYSSNHYAEHPKVGFDYLKMSDEFGGYPGMGFYAEYEVNDMLFLMESTYMQRIAESGKPMWCLEFRSGNGNGSNISGPKGAVRCLGMLTLMKRVEMILGWTWRTMYAGEEKFLFTLLGHDGVPTPNFYEYERLAKDMKKLEKYAFPYLPTPEIGVSYDYSSFWITEYNKDMFKTPYLAVQGKIARLFYNRNTDYNAVDLRNLKNDYKLLIVPNQNIMTKESADTIRKYVENGGTVIMTGTSAFMDENSKVFTTPRPGMLDDVFGIRVAGFNRTDDKWSFSDNTEKVEKNGTVHEQLTISREGRSIKQDAVYYEQLELKSAECFAKVAEKDTCAISCNKYGKGTAYYVAAETDTELLSWLIDEISEEAGLTPAMKVPSGVQSRQIAENQYFYVNFQNHAVEIDLPKSGYGVLTEKDYTDKLILAPYDAELIVTD
ncbi:MAG: beta-galactosidase [Clostridia bacterium]|nr:beta-galactosidase [Clostridia bacterium]